MSNTQGNSAYRSQDSSKGTDTKHLRFSPRSQSASTLQQTQASSSIPCEWVLKQMVFPKKLGTVNPVEFEITVSWEEWTCNPKKARKVKWAYTKKPEDEEGALLPNAETMMTDFFKIGSITLKYNNVGEGQLPDGVTGTWNQYDEPQTLFHEGEVDSFELKCTHGVGKYTEPFESGTFVTNFKWPEP